MTDREFKDLLDLPPGAPIEVVSERLWWMYVCGLIPDDYEPRLPDERLPRMHPLARGEAR